MDKEVFEAVSAEAERLNFPVAKHGPNPINGLKLQSNRGLQSLEHVEDISQGPLNFSFERDEMVSWVSDFREISPVVTPTLATFHYCACVGVKPLMFATPISYFNFQIMYL